MMPDFNILPVDLLDEYIKAFPKDTPAKFEALQDSELTIGAFSFYTSVSAVYSSKIEGEDIELDSYIKHKKLGVKYLPDYTKKIDDLYEAYEFAKKEVLSGKPLLKAHAIITKHILAKKGQGKYRKGNMYVLTPDGKIEYVAIAPSEVEKEMDKLIKDLTILLSTELSFEEIFFFAAMLHLVFVKIHPFEDGNGRTARLLEKWFIAQKLGNKAWLFQSEKYYYEQHNVYYKNIRLLGIEYTELDFTKALPFLLMLPASI